MREIENKEKQTERYKIRNVQEEENYKYINGWNRIKNKEKIAWRTLIVWWDKC